MFSIASKARPYLGAVILCTALLTGWGVYSAMHMPSSVYPEVSFPRIGVVAKAPGRDVTNMEIKVTRPIEEAVSGAIGFAQVRSKTIRGGSELSIDFNPGTDMRMARLNVQERISKISSELPPDLEVDVEQMTPSAFPIMSVVLVGGDDPSSLRDYAFYELKPLIKGIKDVHRVEVAGGDVREIEVICRPDDLLAHGLSAADLADQIGQLTPLAPVGRVEQQPLAYMLLVNNQAAKAREIEELVISTPGSKSQPVRVKDVADVRILHQDRTLGIGFDQKDAVVITVFRSIDGNTLEVSKNVAKLLEDKKLMLPRGAPGKAAPRNIQATIVYDQAKFVESAVDNVRDAIIIGGFFSILILLLFLRSWRATLISAVAIPVTLAITFLFLKLSGETLNLMSLGGLAVAIGLIIDDTVVVVENIARHLSPRARGQESGVRSQGSAVPGNGEANNGAPPLPSGPRTPAPDPVDAASGEITGAVIGSTLTTVLVFVPLAFIVGVYGQFFASLSWSLCIAVLVSMVISLTLIPVCAAKFLAGRPMPEPGRFYNFLANLYEMVLARALRHPVLTVIGSVVVSVAVALFLWQGIPIENRWAQHAPDQQAPPLVPGLKTGLMPAMDEGAFIVDYWAPTGSPLSESEDKARKIEEVLFKNPDVDTYVRRTGSENGLFVTQTSRGDIAVVLRSAEQDPYHLVTKRVRPSMEELEKEIPKDPDAAKQDKLIREWKEKIRKQYRRRPLKDVMGEVEDAVKDMFAEHQFKIDPVQIIADELNDMSGANKPIEVKIFGKDHQTLRDLASKVGEKMEDKGKPVGIKEVLTGVFQGNPDLMIQVDRNAAAKLDMKPDAVARQVRVIYQGQIATQVPESSLRITDVRVRYPNTIRFGTNPSEAGKADYDPERVNEVGKGHFDPERLLSQLILLPDTKLPAAQPANYPLTGPQRAVPLSALAKVKPVRTPDEQWRENQQPAVFISAELSEDASLGKVVGDVRGWMDDKELAMPPGYRWELGGHYLQQQETFRSLAMVMVIAIALVFILLAIQFKSVFLPLLIFLTQPLSLLCGFLALYVTNTPLNVSSAMGVILLIGLDMKNGILLVEYIQQLRGEGMALQPALLLAGRTRFRPILMTSLAAILGMVPLALGIGPGAQMQQPLAIMVIGGLTANMLFTRMVIPVGYELYEWMGDFFKGAPAAPPAVLPQVAPEPVKSIGVVQG